MDGAKGIVTVSPKYQIIIPKNIRESMGLRPGSKIVVLEREGRIELIPSIDPKKARGILKGIDTHIDRDIDRL